MEGEVCAARLCDGGVSDVIVRWPDPSAAKQRCTLKIRGFNGFDRSEIEKGLATRAQELRLWKERELFGPSMNLPVLRKTNSLTH
jgi:hypothetical protein